MAKPMLQLHFKFMKANTGFSKFHYCLDCVVTHFSYDTQGSFLADCEVICVNYLGHANISKTIESIL